MGSKVASLSVNQTSKLPSSRKDAWNNKKQFDSNGFVSEITKQCIDIQQFKKPLI